MKVSFKDKLYVSPSYAPKTNPWVIHVKSGIVSKVNDITHEYSPYCYMGEDGKGMSIYGDVIEIDNVLYCLPINQGHRPYIGVYYLQQSEEKRIDLPIRICRSNLLADMEFTGMIHVGDFIFMMGYAYPGIVRVNTKTQTIDVIDDWVNKINSASGESKFGYFIARQYVIKNGFLYVPFCITNAILKINIDSLETKIINVDVVSEGFSCICEIDNDRFALTGAGNLHDNLYVWDESKEEVLAAFSMQTTPDLFSVIKMLYNKDKKLYLFPWQNWQDADLDIYCFDTEKMYLNRMGFLPKKNDYKSTARHWGDEIIYANWINENTLRFITGWDLKWHEYNFLKKEMCEYEMKLVKTDDNWNRFTKQYINTTAKMQIPMEESEFKLENFLIGLGQY